MCVLRGGGGDGAQLQVSTISYPASPPGVLI